MKESASMKPAAAIRKQLFNLTECESGSAPMVVALHMRTAPGISIGHRLRRIHACARLTLLWRIG